MDNLVLGNGLGLLKDLVGDVLGSGATVSHIVLDTKVIVRSTRVMRGSQEDATVGLVLPDDVRRGGSGENPIGANDELSYIVRGGNLDDNLDGLWGEITTITANHERESLRLDRVEDGLHEVLRVVLSGSDGRCRGPLARDPFSARGERITTFCWNIFTLIKADRQISGPNGRSKQGPHRFLRPEVPGFWPSKGVVVMVFAWRDIVDVKDQGARMTSEGRFVPTGGVAAQVLHYVTWENGYARRYQP